MATVYDGQDQAYQKYLSHSDYMRDEGLIVIPLAKLPTDPPPHYRVVRVHAPVGYRKFTFEAAKIGTPPVVPSLEMTPSGDLPISSKLTFATPNDAADGTSRVFETQGEYTYVQTGYTTYVPGVSQAQVGGLNYARTPGTHLFQTARLPLIRLGTDAAAFAVRGLLGLIPFFGERLQQYFAIAANNDTVLDDLSGRSGLVPPVVDLTDATFNDLAVDIRPEYFTSNEIR